MEAQKLGGSDMLILAASWIFLMASGELPNFLFRKKIMIMSTIENRLLWDGLGGFLGRS